MKQMARLILAHPTIAVLLVILLAGCSQPESPSKEPAGSVPTATPPGESPPANISAPADRPTLLQLDGCSGLTVTQPYAGPLHPAPVPEGFTSNKDAALLASVLEAYACVRVGVGPFERAASIAFELSNHAAPPAACQDGMASGGFWLIHQIWIDDPEIATYLSEVMPVELADITATAGQAPFEAHWAWAEGITLDVANRQNNATWNLLPARYGWQLGDGLAFIDIEYSGQTTGLAGAAATGSAQGTYMGDGPVWDAALIHDATITGEIRFFESMDCS